MQNKIFFSIVIPTLNEEKYLPRLLEDLSKQSFFRDKYEVIIIDGNSEDKTKKIAKAFAKKINLQVFDTKKRNVAYQRNFGAKKAKGEWIVFMDADNRLPNYFLDGIKYQLSKNSQVDIFTTWIKTKEKNKFHQAIAKAINFGMELYQNIGKPASMGSLIVCKKELTKKISFDENQLICEDLYFIEHAYKKNYIFKIFRQPQYFFSMRRLEKEGSLKMSGTAAMAQLRYLSGGDFSKNNYGYHMLGGKYYEDKTSLLSQLNSYIKNSSKSRLEKAKKLLDTIKDPLDW